MCRQHSESCCFFGPECQVCRFPNIPHTRNPSNHIDLTLPFDPNTTLYAQKRNASDPNYKRFEEQFKMLNLNFINLFLNMLEEPVSPDLCKDLYNFLKDNGLDDLIDETERKSLRRRSKRVSFNLDVDQEHEIDQDEDEKREERLRRKEELYRLAREERMMFLKEQAEKKLKAAEEAKLKALSEKENQKKDKADKDKMGGKDKIGDKKGAKDSDKKSKKDKDKKEGSKSEKKKSDSEKKDRKSKKLKVTEEKPAPPKLQDDSDKERLKALCDGPDNKNDPCNTFKYQPEDIFNSCPIACCKKNFEKSSCKPLFEEKLVCKCQSHCLKCDSNESLPFLLKIRLKKLKKPCFDCKEYIDSLGI